MRVSRKKLNEKAEEAARLYEAVVNDYIYLSRKGLKVEAKRLELRLLAVREVAKQLIKAAERAEASIGRKKTHAKASKGPFSTVGETVAGPGPKYTGPSKAVVWHVD